MKTSTLSAVATLSDADLLSRLSQLAAREREVSVELIGHLAELDVREAYLAEGYGSLFIFCTAALRLSEHAAYNRIEAARVARRFPVVLDLLAAGAVNLTILRLLSPHLTAENHEAVLAEATGKRKREVEALVARLSPRPDIGPSVRKLPAPAGSWNPPEQESDLARQVTPRLDGMVSAAETALEGSGKVPTPGFSASRGIVAPLSPERYRVQFTVDKETHEQLRLAQDLLRREIPDGDPGKIFGRALTLLLAQVAKGKMASTVAPRPSRNVAAGSRRIPAEVRRAVWLRDRGQCRFVARSGRRCEGRAFLELHHLVPFALGGDATAHNISLRCRRHNVHEAGVAFGRGAARTRSGTSSHREHRVTTGRSVARSNGSAMSVSHSDANTLGGPDAMS